MEILLAAATAFEIQPTIDYLEGRKGIIGTHSADILITGVGSLAACWALTRQIGGMGPGLVIQAGIAGCFTGKGPGEVIIVNQEVPGDQGVWEGKVFKTVFDMRLADPDSFPFTGGRLVNPYRDLIAFAELEAVRGVTVNEISTDPGRIGHLKQNVAAVVESMEGAALHYACLRAGVPFLQFRSVSNAVGVRDKTKWDIPLAIARLNDKLIGFLEKLEKKSKTHEILTGIQPMPE